MILDRRAPSIRGGDDSTRARVPHVRWSEESVTRMRGPGRLYIDGAVSAFGVHVTTELLRYVTYFYTD